MAFTARSSFAGDSITHFVRGLRDFVNGHDISNDPQERCSEHRFDRHENFRMGVLNSTTGGGCAG